MDATCNPYFTDTFGILFWITQNLRFQSLTPIMELLTRLGGGKFLMMVAATFYWIWYQSKGKVLLYAFSWSVILSALLKYTYTTCRPPEALWIGAPDSYSFPSGHSMVGITVWFGLAFFLKNTPLRLLCCLIGLLVAFSRTYLGLHYPVDVLAGMGLGLLILGITLYTEEHPCEKLAKIPFSIQAIVFFAFLMGLSFLSVFCIASDPHQYAVKSGGALFGLWFGSHFMAQHPARQLPLPLMKSVGQFILGGFGIGVLWSILKVFPLPATDVIELVDISIVVIWLQYALIGAWIVYGAPMLFDKFCRNKLP